MNIHNPILRCLITIAGICAWAAILFGQDLPAASSTVGSSELLSTPKPNVSAEKLLTNYVETGGGYLFLTNGFGVWDSGYLRTVFSADKDILNAEVDGQHEFGDAGIYFAVGDTHNFTTTTYASITLGGSGGGFFLPRYRGDAFLNQKWLSHKQLITTIGLGYYAAKDPHRDRSLSLGTTYYFDRPWVLEDGIRFNLSDPGMVFSPAGFVAVTQGKNKQHYFTARIGYGEEAYQLIGPDALLSSFRSKTVTVTWRQWIGTNWGTNGVADYYGNPYYSRAGASFGLFREF
jgi:YaiO family outer membrane protein